MGIALWCNGSTTDFGSVGHGSSPCSATYQALSNHISYVKEVYNFNSISIIRIICWEPCVQSYSRMVWSRNYFIFNHLFYL